MNSYLKGFLSLFDWEVEKPMSDYEAVGDDMRTATKIVMADDIVNSLSKKIERKERKRG